MALVVGKYMAIWSFSKKNC
ncbi:hypothetical protein Godav_011396 [Gossypium davidsonii]|uniref:Uncharacterized protein n=2 Tax=Gossypium TaxID=3633 RepID=A0A7J8R9V9_GOSDV|nr:hypothetical protein [Gossypium davidsonii]MBA0645664.1 hypothetical protein [Gossypium klotzschianum]